MAILPQIFIVVLSEAYHYVFLLGRYLYRIVFGIWVAFRLVYVTYSARLICFVVVLEFLL